MSNSNNMRGVLLISLFFLIYTYSPAQVEAGEFFFSFSGQRIYRPETAFVFVVVDIEDRHHFSVKRTEKYTGYPVTESDSNRIYLFLSNHNRFVCNY